MALYVGGTSVTGTQTLDATKLTGNLPALNASSLTNLDAADLSGTLPAINGSNLTNLPASVASSATVVGAYALGMDHTYTGGFSASAGGTTSNFRFINVYGNANSGGNASGTWRRHGSHSGNSDQHRSTVYLRIS